MCRFTSAPRKRMQMQKYSHSMRNTTAARLPYMEEKRLKWLK